MTTASTGCIQEQNGAAFAMALSGKSQLHCDGRATVVPVETTARRPGGDATRPGPPGVDDAENCRGRGVAASATCGDAAPRRCGGGGDPARGHGSYTSFRIAGATEGCVSSFVEHYLTCNQLEKLSELINS